MRPFPPYVVGCKARWAAVVPISSPLRGHTAAVSPCWAAVVVSVVRPVGQPLSSPLRGHTAVVSPVGPLSLSRL